MPCLHELESFLSSKSPSTSTNHLISPPPSLLLLSLLQPHHFISTCIELAALLASRLRISKISTGFGLSEIDGNVLYGGSWHVMLIRSYNISITCQGIFLGAYARLSLPWPLP